MNATKKIRYTVNLPTRLVDLAESLKPDLSGFIADCLSNDKLVEKFKARIEADVQKDA
ncbi:hypothetical protein LCGC14_1702180 [marine sediment metagenome]|uniref:Uncharacterized protein n=1 Tax=marine sediment metagenome TaxID=412755 RepID=A0A0F9KHM7_9ZZZZ